MKVVKIVKHDLTSSIEVTVDGKTIISTNYDEIGWSGLSSVEEAVCNLAEELGAEVVYDFH